jgi:malonyl-CoA/methylmalonyl-CoA synthetase
MTPVTPLFPHISSPATGAAVRMGKDVLDYATLSTACAAFRRSLARAGLASGDRVAIWAHPELDTILGFIAAVAAGLVTVPLNPGLGDKELAHILEDAKPDAIFSAYEAQDRARTPMVPVNGFAFSADSIVTPRMFIERDPHDPLLVLYTSGTTGAPKGAVLSAANIAATLDGLIDAWALSARDTIVHGLPLFHAHGLVFGLFGALRAGACLHWIPKFSPDDVARALSEAESSVLYAVPTMYHRLADAADESESVRNGLRAARLLVSGSAALPVREFARIEALTGQRACERYGLSETLINTAVRHDGERRAGYVGTPLAGVEVKLVDDARSLISAHDDQTIGEIAVRGANVFLGYLNNAAATGKVCDEQGWFYTGDLGTLSPDGNLRIVGRKATDLIKTGGFKVGAGEIESALLDHEAVQEAAVIGVDDED